MAYCFTGARHIEYKQACEIRKQLASLQSSLWLVGDASGVDQTVRVWATESNQTFQVFECEGHKPRDFQTRSKLMVDWAASLEFGLIAYPTKPCPLGITVNSWKGSGTWGTVRYALSKGLQIDVRPLIEIPLPEWLTDTQGTLF